MPKYLCAMDRQVCAFLKLISSLKSFQFAPYTKPVRAAHGNLVGRIAKIEISGKYVLVLLGFFSVKSQPDSFAFGLFQPSVYELVRQPNFASLSIIVEDFVKDSGATFSGGSRLVPGMDILCLLWEMSVFVGVVSS